MFIENDLTDLIDLNGKWRFKLGHSRWRTIDVPSAWEASQHDKTTEGPARYRRAFHLDDTEGRLLLEADAISFAAAVRVNGQPAGDHTGMWSRFQIDITPFVHAGENTIEIEVWKPGETRFKLRESLAGFLPDVCNTFGGIWQGIRIRRLRGPALTHLHIATDSDGLLRITATVTGVPSRMDGTASDMPVRADVQCDQDQWAAAIDAHGRIDTYLPISAYAIWSPEAPRLHDVTITLRDNDNKSVAQVRRRIGFRDISTQDHRTRLNGAPIHLRGVLDWGWDEKRLRPALPRHEVIEAFKKAEALGFNLFKLCLYVPDDALFDVADEMGMLLWLELPMWLPKVTPALRELALREYDAILQRVHHHPAIAIVSLGCEMDAGVDAELLAGLRAICSRWLPNALRIDNSGSSEAYGGALAAGGDFYDYHFYTDPHFFQELIDHFRRPYQPNKPWIFGEFCDADTQRDWAVTRQRKPFWLNEPITFKRAELDDAREHAALLRKAGVKDDAASLSEMGRRQADAVRKFVLEQTRRNFASGGYVVTGWKDTPISTSGMIDDAGAVKCNAALWQQFNAGRVLLLDRERRRQWTHGGDRPVQHDPFTWFDDEPMELHLALANGAAAIDDAQLEWRASAGGEVLVNQAERVSVEAGAVNELALLNMAGFENRQGLDEHPVPVRLEARLTKDDTLLACNAWTLWRMPRKIDSTGTVATEINATLLSEVRTGRHTFVWLRDGTTPFVKHMPFWRETVHVFAPAFERIAGMGSLPHADLRFFGVATDLAIDVAALKNELAQPQPRIKHLWRRFDARRMIWHDYAVEMRIGEGRLTVSTLHFAGGLGHQPSTPETNPMGAWLLHRLSQSHGK